MRLHETVKACLTGSAVLLFAVSSAARAGLQDDLNDRWRGAWLIVTGDIYSNCNGLTTDNRISGDLIRGNGRFAFEPGELAQIRKIDAKRSRIDVMLDLREPLLIAYEDGPFTLYREASCEVELEVDFGNERSKDLGVAGIESRLGEWFERYARADDAMESPNYNRRMREDYPDDYEDTLAAYESWKIDQHNQAVADRIADSTEKTSWLLAQVRPDGEFGAGLSKGISDMREAMTDNCDVLLSSSAETFVRSNDSAPDGYWSDGYTTGRELAYNIELSRRLGRCFIGGGDALAFLD